VNSSTEQCMQTANGSVYGERLVIDQEQPARIRHLSNDIVSDASPAPRPQRIEHHGRFVSVEPLDMNRHGDELWDVAGDPDADSTWAYLPYGPWESKEQYLSWVRDRQEADDPLFFAYRDLSSGKTVGVGSLMRITPEARCIEVGHIWFSPPLQKTPAATEAIFLLIKHSMDDLGNRRMEWKCHSMNAGSRRAARRFGFNFEGIFYQDVIVKGRNRDTAWYSILDGEWPAIRAGFEQWLDPANFDAEGRQRVSLATLTIR
jgi:RimJ/RimL family protein N-acetyltransferase